MRTTRRRRRRNIWCWLGLHRWALGVDLVGDYVTTVALCSDCGLLEIAQVSEKLDTLPS